MCDLPCRSYPFKRHLHQNQQCSGKHGPTTANCHYLPPHWMRYNSSPPPARLPPSASFSEDTKPPQPSVSWDVFTSRVSSLPDSSLICFWHPKCHWEKGLQAIALRSARQPTECLIGVRMVVQCLVPRHLSPLCVPPPLKYTTAKLNLNT